MLVDRTVVAGNANKPRRDWGLQNVVGLDNMNRAAMQNNAHRTQQVKRKIENFVQTAVYPQQLTIPRQYATTKEGVRVYKVLENREVDKVAGGGVRIVVQENMQQSRFMMSPLLKSKHDAFQWAFRNTGAKI